MGTYRAKIHGKVVRVELSKAAIAELARQREPLVAEMELYFSCLIRKRVRFKAMAPGAIPVTTGLYIRFRPAMTARCAVGETNDEVLLTDFPIVNVRAFVPAWLTLDYRSGQWRGNFGLGRSEITESVEPEPVPRRAAMR